MGEHLVLVGLMGVGKSTVGRRLADRLGRVFLDSDSLIEARAGRSVRDIFAEDGEAAFRDLETEVLRDALASDVPSVIAGGGGIVVRPENREVLREGAERVVWLRAGVDTLVARVSQGGHRPLLDADPTGVLTRLDAEREPWYRDVAHVVIGVDGRSVDDVVEAVLR
ncbi:MAG: shikimate kinase [Ilumatobacteraceae bacterium]